MHELTVFLKALELPAKVLLGIFISSAALMVSNYLEFISLNLLWVHALLLTKVTAIVSGCLLLASGLSLLVEDKISARKASIISRRRATLEEEKKAKIEEKKSKNLLLLDSLSYEEKIVISQALRTNSMSVAVPFDSVGANLLRSKSLGVFAGGVIDMDRAAFTIAPYVWEALQERKEAILADVPEPPKRRQRW